MSILGNLAAVAIKTALLPVVVSIDVVTMGGAVTDSDESCTSAYFKGVCGNISNAIKELEK